MTFIKYSAKFALVYFVIAAVLGVLLRSVHSVGILINYKFIVHTHSHIALLGWVYLALTTLLYKLYLGELGLDKKYLRIFWFTQLTLAGMLLTFPFQGYALFSIIFSTLFLFASYWFFWFFEKNTQPELKKSNSYKCVKMALWFMVLSSLGPWGLGAIMNTLGAESIWYRMAIYFFLHFQYNGWMVMSLFGLLFFVLERHEIYLSEGRFQSFFWSINLGIVLSFLLSSLWIKPSLFVNLIGGIGVVFQLFALLVLIWALMPHKDRMIALFSKFQWTMLKTILALLGVKITLQLLTAHPYFANLAVTILDFTIGYLHWTFLGVVTIGLFLFLDYFKVLKIPKKTYTLYLIGFLTTEALIFYKGVVAWQGLVFFEGFLHILALASVLIPLSLVFILFANLFDKS